jgi:hypothetical protein
VRETYGKLPRCQPVCGFISWAYSSSGLAQAGSFSHSCPSRSGPGPRSGPGACDVVPGQRAARSCGQRAWPPRSSRPSACACTAAPSSARWPATSLHEPAADSRPRPAQRGCSAKTIREMHFTEGAKGGRLAQGAKGAGSAKFRDH